MEAAARALKVFTAMAMLWLGVRTLPIPPLVRTPIGTIAPFPFLILLLAATVVVVGSGGLRAARIAYLLSLLLFAPAVLSYSHTDVLGLRTAMPFGQVLVTGILIQACFLVLEGITSAERTYTELVRRGADEGAARGVFTGLLSLSAALTSLSLAIPLVTHFSIALAGGTIAPFVVGIPIPTLVVPLAAGAVVFASVLFYLAGAKD